MKRDLPFRLMVSASAFGLVTVVITVVAGGRGSSLPAVLGAGVVLVVGWTAVVARQESEDDRDVTRPPVAGPPARLVLTRGDDAAGMLRHIRVSVDGVEVAGLKPLTSAEVEVRPGRHRVRAAMDWTTSPALDLDLVPGERVEVRVGLPFSMIWRMVTAPRATLTIERIERVEGRGRARRGRRAAHRDRRVRRRLVPGRDGGRAARRVRRRRPGPPAPGGGRPAPRRGGPPRAGGTGWPP